jgi:hypothetical protein
MAQKSLPLLGRSLLPVVVALAGCNAPSDNTSDDVEVTSQADTASNGLSFNGLSFNGMSFNGLSFNGLSYNGLSYNGLSFNGMSYNGLSFNGLGDPVVHDFVAYLVGCALPAGDSVAYEIKGTKYTFAGDLGVAPEWKKRRCDESCQKWVSACMLARLNKKGEHVEISLRGENPGLALERGELETFKVREGSYYGNLFDDDQPIFACYSPGTPALLRVCGDSLAGCPMRVAGPCDRACRSVNGRTGAFRDCGPGSRGKSGKNGDDLFAEVVTVFLR